MSTYAVIESGMVTNVAEWDGSSEWADSFKAVLVTDSVGIGWSYDGSTFTAPPVETSTEDEEAAAS